MPKGTLKEIEEIMTSNQGTGSGKDEKPFLSNHSGYDYEGSENFEHDNNGDIHNYSGVVDEVNNALKEHEGWQEGYDL